MLREMLHLVLREMLPHLLRQALRFMLRWLLRSMPTSVLREMPTLLPTVVLRMLLRMVTTMLLSVLRTLLLWMLPRVITTLLLTVLPTGKTCFYGGVFGLSGRRPNLCGCVWLAVVAGLLIRRSGCRAGQRGDAGASPDCFPACVSSLAVSVSGCH